MLKIPNNPWPYTLRIGDRDFSAEERKKMAESGAAMSDGSYPIVSYTDLHNAIQSFGRHATEAVKQHIIKRARALGRTDMLPEDWK